MAADRSRTQHQHSEPQDHSPSWVAAGERKKRELWVICRRHRRSRELAPARDFGFKGTGPLLPASDRGRCLSAAGRGERRGARTSGEGRALVCTPPHPCTQPGRRGLCGPGGGVGAGSPSFLRCDPPFPCYKVTPRPRVRSVGGAQAPGQSAGARGRAGREGGPGRGPPERAGCGRGGPPGARPGAEGAAGVESEGRLGGGAGGGRTRAGRSREPAVRLCADGCTSL